MGSAEFDSRQKLFTLPPVRTRSSQTSGIATLVLLTLIKQLLQPIIRAMHAIDRNRRTITCDSIAPPKLNPLALRRFFSCQHLHASTPVARSLLAVNLQSTICLVAVTTQ